MIWAEVPKDSNVVGANVFHLGVFNAVSHFNIGSQVALNVLTSTGVEPGQFCLDEMRRIIDKLRLSKATYKERDAAKRQRKLLRAQWKHKGDQAQENEGVTYAAGSF